MEKSVLSLSHLPLHSFQLHPSGLWKYYTRLLLPWVHPDSVKVEMCTYKCSGIFPPKDHSLSSLSPEQGWVGFLISTGIPIYLKKHKGNQPIVLVCWKLFFRRKGLRWHCGVPPGQQQTPYQSLPWLPARHSLHTGSDLWIGEQIYSFFLSREELGGAPSIEQNNFSWTLCLRLQLLVFMYRVL